MRGLYVPELMVQSIMKQAQYVRDSTAIAIVSGSWLWETSRGWGLMREL